MMPCSEFFAADRAYSRMEVPGMNPSRVDLSGDASSQAIVYLREKENSTAMHHLANASTVLVMEYTSCDGYNHRIYFADQDLEAERVYSGIEYSTSIAFLGPDDIYSYITELVFLDSSMPGAEYENNLFAAARHNERKGNIYHFELDRNRTGLVLKRPLVDSTLNVVTSGNEQVISLQEDLIRSLIWKLDPTVIYMC
jgi:hypothetical protein